MAKKKIFIGSATESLEIAKKIAQMLSLDNYYSVRWWNEFQAGSITIDRLLEVSDNVDGAIFIMSSSDTTWYRGVENTAPRDNLLLEYGIFVKSLGRKRTVILKEKDVRLPTDIDSITYERLVNDVDSVGERLINHFDSIFSNSLSKETFSTTKIIADPTVIDKQLNQKLPRDWYSRNLLLGSRRG